MENSIHTRDEIPANALEVAVAAARSAGTCLLHFFQQGQYWARSKQDTSLQTKADMEAEEIILRQLREAFPDHTLQSEERGTLFSSRYSPYRWSIDPLDGTENFVLGIPYFSSCLTLYYQQRPCVAVVYNPVTDELFTARRGVGAQLNGLPLVVSRQSELPRSRVFFIPDFVTKRQSRTVRLREALYRECRRVLDTWSPALDWCLVANGKVDVVVTFAHGTPETDASAGMFILEEAGGRITDFAGHPSSLQNMGQLVGSNATTLHDAVLQVIKEVYHHDDTRTPVARRPVVERD